MENMGNQLAVCFRDLSYFFISYMYNSQDKKVQGLYIDNKGTY